MSHLLIIEDFILFIKKRFEEINKEKKSEMKCFLIPGIKGVAGKRSLASSYQNISHWQEPKTPFGQNHNSEPRNTSTWHSAGLILYSRAKARIGRSRDIHSSSNPSRGISTGQDWRRSRLIAWTHSAKLSSETGGWAVTKIIFLTKNYSLFNSTLFESVDCSLICFKDVVLVWGLCQIYRGSSL